MKLSEPKPLLKRFEEKFIKKSIDECWPWIYGKHRGYGRFSFDGRPAALAHRVSYILYSGEIPKGMLIIHKCDNKICVNPNHLEIGTQKQNVHDAIYRAKSHRNVREKNKTHCVHGHEYTKENTQYNRGFRKCRECGLIYKRNVRIKNNLQSSTNTSTVTTMAAEIQK